MPPTRRQTFNKVRGYRCKCGGVCIRPLHGNPKACERCGQRLTGTPYAIEDQAVFVRSLVDEIRRRKGG